MRDEPRPQLSAFERKILSDNVPENATDNQILESIFILDDRAAAVPKAVAESYRKIVSMLRSQLHGL
jgi:hypothetical protein